MLWLSDDYVSLLGAIDLLCVGIVEFFGPSVAVVEHVVVDHGLAQQFR
jgi:hypothetical protein